MRQCETGGVGTDASRMADSYFRGSSANLGEKIAKQLGVHPRLIGGSSCELGPPYTNKPFGCLGRLYTESRTVAG